MADTPGTGGSEQVPGGGPNSGRLRRGGKSTEWATTVRSIDQMTAAWGRTHVMLTKVRDVLRDINRLAPNMGGGGGGGAYFGSNNMTTDLLKKAKDNGVSGEAAAVSGAQQFATSYLLPAAAAIGKATNERIERGYSYSLSADKMSVMYQQMTGLNQQQVQDKYRYPLTQYRLGGYESTNALLGMQAATGISAVGQASSIASIRAISGYGYSAEDAAKMVTTLGSPEVANRMFLTTGMSLYGIGGKQNSTMSVIQNLAQKAGLTNERVVAGALQQGSASRMRLEYMGVSQDMQDMVLQYAQENIQFQKKGGKGMYDPSKKEDRRRMGIEENFATQKEETDRLKNIREENFYNRQADNFASLERVTQSLTKMFGKLEDKLSGIVGAKVSSGGIGSMVGTGMSVLGMGLTMAGQPEFGIPLLLGGALITGKSPLDSGGDPMPNDSGAGTTYPTYGGSRPLSAITSSSSFSGLHPQLRSRVQAMIVESGGRVGFGNGLRSSADQEAMFRARYTPTDQETDIFWEGKYWKHTSGAPAAPPGHSMHELGLAADLTGDMDWIKANAARFGLKHFGGVNGEPWHVQPAELPNGRSEYEKNGSSWGGSDKRSSAKSIVPQSVALSDGDWSSVMTSLGSKSVTEIFDEYKHMGNAAFNQGQQGAGGLSYSVASQSNTQSVVRSSEGGNAASLMGSTKWSYTDHLSARQMYILLAGHGWAGDELVQGAAIAWKESNWDPHSFNDNESTGDLSYGLFQHNMHPKGTNPEGNRKAWGLSSNEDLFDPVKNTWVARQKFNWNKAHGRDPWYDWGAYKGNPTGWMNVDLAAMATKMTAASKESGDPFTSTGGGGGGGGTTVVSGGTNVTIAPVINLYGSGNLDTDLPRIAREVGLLLEREAAIINMRSI